MAGKKTTNSGKPEPFQKAKGAPSSEGQQNRSVSAVSTKSAVSATVDTLDGPLGQTAPVVPPAPNEKDFLLAKSAVLLLLTSVLRLLTKYSGLPHVPM
ncbi:hypothetical protein HYE67_001545 [Fusarium culmorum]|uniref:Uncharacterized protein n=1 Tax=Fusarium culmorum TaxID=5516 RepID=A0A7S8CZR9_FUSCU|nr:hypothetical protein HYE67_001545 [Fusarium culmorum]